MGESWIIITDLDQRADAIRRQHPLQRLAHLQVAVGSTNTA